MKKATEIFEKHWTKATGKPLDETTKHHMKYAIEAINEALFLNDISVLHKQFVCNCPDEKLWSIHGKIVCECGKYH